MWLFRVIWLFCVNGIVAIATRAKGTLMVSISMKATGAMAHWTMIEGPKVRYIWTERMSELAREISCPDWARS
jgi:hypothetical protein